MTAVILYGAKSAMFSISISLGDIEWEMVLGGGRDGFEGNVHKVLFKIK